MNFTSLIMVGIGGFFGSMGRYAMVVWVKHLCKGDIFPWGTLVVNALGCLVLGYASGLVYHKNLLSSHLQLLIMVGFLGGFTTFSTFGADTVNLFRTHHNTTGLLYVLAQLVLGVSLSWGGFAASKIS